MSEDTEFREAVKRTIRQHDPSASELRALAADLQDLADRYETQDEIL